MSMVVHADGLGVRLGPRQVLEGVSFSAEAGDLVAVLGPNGSGKSTLVRALVGLIEPSQGHLVVLGSAPGSSAAGRIGYVPQIKSLDRTFPALALELVVSAHRNSWPGPLRRADREWGLAALERAGAAHLANRQVSRLSGGELQRIYLARAIAQDVKLLILDEPESGIDAAGTSDLYEQLDAFREHSSGTVILVTHDWDAALHHASRVLLLKGRQIAFGPPTEALSESNLRAAFGHVGHAHAMHGGRGHS